MGERRVAWLSAAEHSVAVHSEALHSEALRGFRSSPIDFRGWNGEGQFLIVELASDG